MSTSDPDVSYYRERSAALATGQRSEIPRTDFSRLRRGRLYLTDPWDVKEQQMQRRVGEAFQARDDAGLAKATAEILEHDQADIRSHMLWAIAARRAGRTVEADFHRAVALALVASVVGEKDGHSLENAWIAYRVKEEYETLKVLGYEVGKQSLKAENGRHFDVLEASNGEGSGVVEFYFDITELRNEEARRFGVE